MIVPGVGQITASFGVAECPVGGQTAAEMLNSSDVALYEAKRAGRDRVILWEASSSDRDSNPIVIPDVQSDELVQ
jgi:predicted signal transduction protein with EAL and GGDEF domain